MHISECSIAMRRSFVTESQPREHAMTPTTALKAFVLPICLTLFAGCTDLKPIQAQIDDLKSQVSKAQSDATKALSDAAAANQAAAAAGLTAAGGQTTAKQGRPPSPG